MVCPMRFLLLGASAVVAVLAVVYTCQSSETAVDTTSGQSRKVTSDFFLLHCAIPSLGSTAEPNVLALLFQLQVSQGRTHECADMPLHVSGTCSFLVAAAVGYVDRQVPVAKMAAVAEV